MTTEQAAAIIDLLSKLHQVDLVILGALLALIFAVSWKA